MTTEKKFFIKKSTINLYKIAFVCLAIITLVIVVLSFNADGASYKGWPALAALTAVSYVNFNRFKSVPLLIFGCENLIVNIGKPQKIEYTQISDISFDGSFFLINTPKTKSPIKIKLSSFNEEEHQEIIMCFEGRASFKKSDEMP